MKQATKKKSKKQKKRDGLIVRLSKEVLDMFPREGSESYDKAFRRKLGMLSKIGGTRFGTYWILTKPKVVIFGSKAEALGASIMSMVSKKGQRKESPKKVVVLK